MSEERTQPDAESSGNKPPSQIGRGRVRPLEIALGVVLAAAVGLAIFVSQRGANLPMPSSALDHVATVEPAPVDEDLATFNALAYHLYALKNDVGQYDRVRANLANLATSGGLASGIETVHGALLDLCRECERYFVDRKELDETRRLGRRENIFRGVSSAGGLTLGAAAKFVISDVNPLGLALAGGMAASRAAGHFYDNRKIEEQYRAAVDKARVALNDQIARTEHCLVNFRAEMEAERQWPPAWQMTESTFRTYTDGLACFAEEDWNGALQAFAQVGSLPGMGEALFYSGLARLALDEPEEAAAQLHAAIERQPANFVYSRELTAAAYYHLAAIRLGQQDWSEAIGHANAALRLAGDQADFHCLRGEILLAAGHTPQASEAFKRALEVDDGSARAAYGLSQALAQRGRQDEALEFLEQAAREGRINLSDAGQNSLLTPLRGMPRFNALTSLDISVEIDWGPISDKVRVTNNNAFPLTNLVVLARRKNSTEEDEKAEVVEAPLLEPGATLAIKGDIGGGPKSRTEYFAYELECDQGEWSHKHAIEAEEN
jgi:tetratricopeptide (TPR) repeat protein